MNKHYKKAQTLIEKAIEKLSEITEPKGEDKDISCYAPSLLQESINLLIKAGGSMVIARSVDRGWKSHATISGFIKLSEIQDELSFPEYMEEPTFERGEIVSVSNDPNKKCWHTRRFLEEDMTSKQRYRCEGDVYSVTRWEFIRKLNKQGDE